jgi:hypothetical protein
VPPNHVGKTINPVRGRDLVRDFEPDGLEVYKSPQTNLGAALTALNHPKILLRYDVFKLTCVSPPLGLKKEALDIVDQQQVPTA